VQNSLCVQILRSPVFAALPHGTRVVGVSQTLRRSAEGATYIRQGGHHVEHRPTFYLSYMLLLLVRSVGCAETVEPMEMPFGVWACWHNELYLYIKRSPDTLESEHFCAHTSACQDVLSIYSTLFATGSSVVTSY